MMRKKKKNQLIKVKLFKNKFNQKDNMQNSSEIDESFNGNNKIRNTFVGTAEYVSPEVLNDEFLGSECDLWALGCIIYRCLVGITPFKDKTEFLIFENIRKNNLRFPKVFFIKKFL